MHQDHKQKKQAFARTVTTFLTEGLRTKNLSLERAVDIGKKILANINLLDTEHDFLRFIKELSIDFEELKRLETDIVENIKSNDRLHKERLVKDFVVSSLSHDIQASLKIMEEASQPQTDLKHLFEKYPNFKHYAETHGKH